MNRKLVKSAAALAFAAASLGAFASTYDGQCTDKPKSEWKSTADIKAHFETQGYTVGKIKASGTCYEVYAKDKDGKRVELFVNPADASVVGQAGTK
ncbi:MAG: PepSY domain-containing protein [Proteobacteria bacterium]|nr:PepSY domain-containing protein [Pseudomonadota bacterium]